MGTEIKAAAIAAALGAFAGGAPGEAPVGTEQRSNAGAHLVPGAGPAGAATMRAAVQHRYGPPAVLQVGRDRKTAAWSRRRARPGGRGLGTSRRLLRHDR